MHYITDCVLTEWSDWSECVVEANCPAKPEDSYPAPPKDHQLNEARRALHMAQKDMAFSRITACKEAGTCPELVSTEKSTPSTCTNGMVYFSHSLVVFPLWDV